MEDYKEILEQYACNYYTHYRTSYDYLIPLIEKVMNDLNEINTRETHKAVWKIKNTMWLFNVSKTYVATIEGIQVLNKLKEDGKTV